MQESAFQNVVRELVPILSRSGCVKAKWTAQHCMTGLIGRKEHGPGFLKWHRLWTALDSCINTWRLGQNGCHFVDVILKCISLTGHCNPNFIKCGFLKVQLTTSHYKLV